MAMKKKIIDFGNFSAKGGRKNVPARKKRVFILTG